VVLSAKTECRSLLTQSMPSEKPAEAPETVKPSLVEVFKAEESPLLRYAFGLVGRRAVAEDLVQDAFLRLHEHWEDVKHPRAWLFRCVRNRAYNHVRDHKKETLTDLMDETEGPQRDVPDEALERMEAAGLVHMLLGEMTERDQKLIQLKYFEDQKYTNISEETGMSVGNVGYRLHHILKTLADSLRKAGIEGAR